MAVAVIVCGHVVPRRHMACIYATGTLALLLAYEGELVNGYVREPTMLPEVQNMDAFDEATKGVPDAVATEIAAKLEDVGKCGHGEMVVDTLTEESHSSLHAVEKKYRATSWARTPSMEHTVRDLSTSAPPTSISARLTIMPPCA